MDIKKVIKRYNNLVSELGYEHVTIGTDLSENTGKWNLRDMVAEADYLLSTYYEKGYCNNELKEDSYKDWRSNTGKLERFIKRFKPEIDKLKCSEGHCSQFD